MEPAGFRLGGEAAEYVELTILGRSNPGATDFWDGNWLVTEVQLQSGGFTGAFKANLRTHEIADFAAELRGLHTALRGSAELRTMEQQLKLSFTGDGRGHLNVQCEAHDQAGCGNQLRFELSTDQTELPPLLRQLDDVLSRYPVIGKPAA
jgi:hypothetical protein